MRSSQEGAERIWQRRGNRVRWTKLLGFLLSFNDIKKNWISIFHTHTQVCQEWRLNPSVFYDQWFVCRCVVHVAFCGPVVNILTVAISANDAFRPVRHIEHFVPESNVVDVSCSEHVLPNLLGNKLAKLKGCSSSTYALSSPAKDSATSYFPTKLSMWCSLLQLSSKLTLIWADSNVRQQLCSLSLACESPIAFTPNQLLGRTVYHRLCKVIQKEP